MDPDDDDVISARIRAGAVVKKRPAILNKQPMRFVAGGSPVPRSPGTATIGRVIDQDRNPIQCAVCKRFVDYRQVRQLPKTEPFRQLFFGSLDISPELVSYLDNLDSNTDKPVTVCSKHFDTPKEPVQLALHEKSLVPIFPLRQEEPQWVGERVMIASLPSVHRVITTAFENAMEYVLCQKPNRMLIDASRLAMTKEALSNYVVNLKPIEARPGVPKTQMYQYMYEIMERIAQDEGTRLETILFDAYYYHQHTGLRVLIPVCNRDVAPYAYHASGRIRDVGAGRLVPFLQHQAGIGFPLLLMMSPSSMSLTEHKLQLNIKSMSFKLKQADFKPPEEIGKKKFLYVNSSELHAQWSMNKGTYLTPEIEAGNYIRPHRSTDKNHDPPGTRVNISKAELALMVKNKTAKKIMPPGTIISKRVYLRRETEKNGDQPTCSKYFPNPRYDPKRNAFTNKEDDPIVIDDESSSPSSDEPPKKRLIRQVVVGPHSSASGTGTDVPRTPMTIASAIDPHKKVPNRPASYVKSSSSSLFLQASTLVPSRSLEMKDSLIEKPPPVHDIKLTDQDFRMLHVDQFIINQIDTRPTLHLTLDQRQHLFEAVNERIYNLDATIKDISEKYEILEGYILDIAETTVAKFQKTMDSGTFAPRIYDPPKIYVRLPTKENWDEIWSLVAENLIDIRSRFVVKAGKEIREANAMMEVILYGTDSSVAYEKYCLADQWCFHQLLFGVMRHKTGRDILLRLIKARGLLMGVKGGIVKDTQPQNQPRPHVQNIHVGSESTFTLENALRQINELERGDVVNQMRRLPINFELERFRMELDKVLRYMSVPYTLRMSVITGYLEHYIDGDNIYSICQRHKIVEETFHLLLGVLRTFVDPNAITLRKGIFVGYVYKTKPEVIILTEMALSHSYLNPLSHLCRAERGDRIKNVCSTRLSDGIRAEELMGSDIKQEPRMPHLTRGNDDLFCEERLDDSGESESGTTNQYDHSGVKMEEIDPDLLGDAYATGCAMTHEEDERKKKEDEGSSMGRPASGARDPVSDMEEKKIKEEPLDLD